MRVGRGGEEDGGAWRRLRRGASAGEETPMKKHLSCPCGTFIEGENEDDLVEKVQAHLAEKHPDHQYTRDEILFIAY
jgi:hypothetical protein